MAENKHTPHEEPVRFDPDLSDPANRHDKSEVDYRAITKFGVALTLLCIVTFALIVGMFRYMRDRVADTQQKTAAPIDARRLPPEPRLQSTPLPDLASMRAAEEEILNNYAWTDPDKRMVRIPIKQAMEILAKRGLQARTENPPVSDVTVPTESGLGPKVHQPGGPLAAEMKAQPAGGEDKR